ncbi:MAG: hypothetical protein ACRD5Z_10575, partial [Bryobacteraceae bacterium]
VFLPGGLFGVVVLGTLGVVEPLDPAPVLPRCAIAPGITKIASARGRSRCDRNHDDIFGPIGTSH